MHQPLTQKEGGIGGIDKGKPLASEKGAGGVGRELRLHQLPGKRYPAALPGTVERVVRLQGRRQYIVEKLVDNSRVEKDLAIDAQDRDLSEGRHRIEPRRRFGKIDESGLEIHPLFVERDQAPLSEGTILEGNQLELHQ